jgi:hypothetical protein
MRTALLLFGAMAVATTAAAQSEFSAWQSELARARQAGREVLPEEDAAGAVDGQTRGTFSFHTGQDENPFWQVDLQAPHTLGQVVVYNTPHAPERALRLKILLSMDGRHWREAYQHDGTPFVGTGDLGPLVVPLPAEQTRLVRIELPGHTWLHLDEVQVVAADGETNLAAGKPATQSSTSEWSTRSITIASRESAEGELQLARRVFEPVLRSLGSLEEPLRGEFDVLIGAEIAASDPRWAELYGRALTARQRLRAAQEGLERFSPRALRMALEDMAASHPERWGDLTDALARIAAIEMRLPALVEALASGAEGALAEAEAVVRFQRDLLLANPLLDFNRLVVLRRNLGSAARSAMGSEFGLAANFHANDTVSPFGWDNEIATITDFRDNPQLTTLYRPADDRIVADLKLDFDGQRLLFASVGNEGSAWRIFETDIDGTGVMQVTPDQGADVSHSDPCYLPDGRIIFASTANYVGLPCVFGSAPMVALYRMDRATGQDPPAHLRAGQRLVSHGDQQRPGDVPAMGIRRPAALELADPLPHEPRRHGADGVLRQQLVLPAVVLLRPAGSGPSFDGGGHRHRPPRHAPLGPAAADRSGAGPPRGRRRGAGDSRLGQAGRADRGRPDRRRRLAPVSAPDAVERKLLPRGHEGRPDALWGIYLVDVFDNITLWRRSRGRPCCSRSPVQPRPRRAGHRRQGGPAARRRHGPGGRRVPRPRPDGHPPRRGEAASRHQLLLVVARDGRTAGQHRHGRSLGHQTGAGHRAGRGRRLGPLLAFRPTSRSRSSRSTPKGRPCS